MAYGLLALTPREFADLSPVEFARMVEGATERRQWWMELAAWAVSNLMNAAGTLKRRVSVDDLLGPDYTLRQIQRRTEQKKKKSD